MTKYNILLADDDHTQLALLQKTFHPKIYTLLYSPDAEKAYWVAEQELPDLIIMDWIMPGCNGLEAIEKFQKNELTKDIPIIMATGYMKETSHLKQAFDSGAVDFIRKPYDTTELKARADTALRIKEYQKRQTYQQLEIQIHHQRERLKLQEKLKNQQSELNAQAIFEQKYQKLFSELNHDLKCLREELKDVTVPSMFRLEKGIRQGLKTQKRSKSFLYHFKKADPTFFKTLNRLGLQLTNQDMRYCAYFKLNLNYQEIADMQGVEVTSVRRHVYRLRKKLGLDQTQDIRSYVNTLS